ncbi:MAG: DNA mismatch repair protein MutS [Nitrospira bacterium HGW-Nitrospira-1]|nr:MAG: DNA mismatch repair protein MutS [Nitrospira bacterium HGW-Nitrospira-1]
MPELTPVMKQYNSIKEQYQDCIVLFRLGDFYEMFGEDAQTASKILQIALTTRDKSKDDPMPMCGVPYFAAESYISRLIKAGHKVAVCEQMEDPKDAKGIVLREVVRVITPGTHTPEHPKENTYILSIFPSGDRHGIAAADISTGEFFVFQTDKNIEDEVNRFEPKEILMPASLKDSIHYKQTLSGFYISGFDDWLYDYAEAYKTLLTHFRVSSLEGYGCEGSSAAISAAGALIHYIENTQKGFPVFKKITTLQQTAHMFLDTATQRNLELTHNLKDGSRESTLLWTLDETLSPMGGRFLRAALLRPLTDIAEINRRQAAIEYLMEDFELLESLRNSLRNIQDLERLATRVSAGTANARDMTAIKNSLSFLPMIKKMLSVSKEHYLKSLANEISEFSLLRDLIGKAIVDSPPLSIRDGGLIRDGYHAEVDTLRNISTRGKDFIAEMELGEKKRTGISSLKIGYNKVFGYYIEVTKSNLDMVPEDYIRKQTLVSGERFITPELKEYENNILGSEEKLKNLEQEVFHRILESVRKETDQLFKTAGILAVVDFLASLTVTAKRRNYARPLMVEECVVDISEGRHPALERVLAGERFIPNNTYIDTQDHQLLMITGPNMAGKSTYMRQVALIVLMAQIGSFVPASSAKIGITDRIFTRIGAADFLTKGQSTFMVEMIEVANIINNATEKSLIILDEVGRGTSTFDGISIAWALAEHILNRIKARTLFATHYNELTELSLIHDGVKNYNISVREWGDEIIFLRKIEEGPADKSYGIQVARLAGVPDAIIGRAKEVLYNLQNESLNETGKPRLSSGKAKKRREQLDLFSSAHETVISEIVNLETDSLSPEEALSIIRELSGKLKFR